MHEPSHKTWWSVWFKAEEVPSNQGALVRACPSTWTGSEAELRDAWRRTQAALLEDLPPGEAAMIREQLEQAAHKDLMGRMLHASNIADPQLLRDCAAAATQVGSLRTLPQRVASAA